jgi:hypothetical protein
MAHEVVEGAAAVVLHIEARNRRARVHQLVRVYVANDVGMVSAGALK